MIPKRDASDESSLRGMLAADSTEAKQKTTKVKASDLVWVTQDDNDLILRVKWAQQKIIEQANRLLLDDDESPRDRFVKRKSDEEAWNLRSLVAYLFSGDVDVLRLNKYELKTFIRGDLDAEKREREKVRKPVNTEIALGADDNKHTGGISSAVINKATTSLHVAELTNGGTNGGTDGTSTLMAPVEKRNMDDGQSKSAKSSASKPQLCGNDDTNPDPHSKVEADAIINSKPSARAEIAANPPNLASGSDAAHNYFWR